MTYFGWIFLQENPSKVCHYPILLYDKQRSDFTVGMVTYSKEYPGDLKEDHWLL
jgi:hypothetical protein